MSGKASQDWPELSGVHKRFAIVASRFNHDIVERLVEGARRALVEFGVSSDHIDVFWCPGALEIPALARRVAHQKDDGAQKYDGIVCCGAVVRGETDHYQFVAAEAMRGISALANEATVAIGNAILTVANVQQAWDRARDDNSNKGYEAAIAALVMAQAFEKLA